jgi:hypothetical protein
LHHQRQLGGQRNGLGIVREQGQCGGEVWPVLSLKSLVESQSFLQAAS